MIGFSLCVSQLPLCCVTQAGGSTTFCVSPNLMALRHSVGCLSHERRLKVPFVSSVNADSNHRRAIHGPMIPRGLPVSCQIIPTSGILTQNPPKYPCIRRQGIGTISGVAFSGAAATTNKCQICRGGQPPAPESGDPKPTRKPKPNPPQHQSLTGHARSCTCRSGPVSQPAVRIGEQRMSVPHHTCA